MKVLERDKAIGLRRQGWTFSEILREIPVSKGSLSYWLRDVQLNQEQLGRIQYKNDRIKEKFIEFNEIRKRRSELSKITIFNSAFYDIKSISEKELKLIGIALYWAEGYKAGACSGVEFTNSDPLMVQLMMRWFRKICGAEEKRFRIRIQIHNITEKERIESYWSEVTGVPIAQFTKTYTKTSPTSKQRMGNITPNGTCSIRISDIKLITRIKGWIKGLMALSSSPV